MPLTSGIFCNFSQVVLLQPIRLLHVTTLLLDICSGHPDMFSRNYEKKKTSQLGNLVAEHIEWQD